MFRSQSLTPASRVDLEVLVDQDVAEAGNLLPFNSGLARSNVGGELLDRLTDHLEIANDGVEGLLVGGERLPRKDPCTALNPRDGLEDVLQVDPGVPGHAELRPGSYPGAGV